MSKGVKEVYCFTSNASKPLKASNPAAVCKEINNPNIESDLLAKISWLSAFYTAHTECINEIVIINEKIAKRLTSNRSSKK